MKIAKRKVFGAGPSGAWKVLAGVAVVAAISTGAIVARSASSTSGSASAKDARRSKPARPGLPSENPPHFGGSTQRQNLPSVETIIARNLFRPRLASTAKPDQPPSSLPILPMPVVAGLPAQGAAGNEGSTPASEWFYAGHATLGDRAVAFVENRTTHEGLMLSVGDTFNGGTVNEIRPDSLVLMRGSSVERIARTDAFNVTPLNEPPRQSGRAGSGVGSGGQGRLRFAVPDAGASAGQPAPQGGGAPPPGRMGGFLRDFMRSPQGQEQMRLFMQRMGSDVGGVLGQSGQGN